MVKILMVPDKQCKGSVRYASGDPQAPVQSIYLDRSFSSKMPAAIIVTIEEQPAKPIASVPPISL